MEPVAKDEVSELKMETVSEIELAQESGRRMSGETSKSEVKPEVEGKDLTSESEGLISVEANVTLKCVPEKTDVLKLETEVHNEYFQAPPLWQTLTFQAHKSKSGLQVEPTCLPTAEKDIKKDISENAEVTSGKRSEMSKVGTTEPEQPDVGAAVGDSAEIRKAAEIPSERPDSNSPVRQVLNALQSLSSHSWQSPETVDSDDSPSALEMEDIPAGITCITTEDISVRPLAGLAAPPVSFAQRKKMAPADLALDHHLDTACNTSPEGTDLGLSEEEPEMENMLTEPESADAGEEDKHEDSPEEHTYSVSIARHAHMVAIIVSTH